MASSSVIGTFVVGAISASAPWQKVLPKNAVGNRSVVWKHGVEALDNPRSIHCKYCQNIITGGAYGLKHHLVGTQKIV